MNERPVRFTRHAIEKLALAAEQGFVVSNERIVENVRHPPRVYRGSNDNPVVHIPIDDDHILRVAFDTNGEIVVVTVYPAGRNRYEI